MHSMYVTFMSCFEVYNLLTEGRNSLIELKSVQTCMYAGVLRTIMLACYFIFILANFLSVDKAGMCGS